MPETTKKALTNLSWRKTKKIIEDTESSVVLTPDSVPIVTNTSRHDATNEGIGSVYFDVHTWYIFNKNRWEYIQQHHLSVPGVRIFFLEKSK